MNAYEPYDDEPALDITPGERVEYRPFAPDASRWSVSWAPPAVAPFVEVGHE